MKTNTLVQIAITVSIMSIIGPLVIPLPFSPIPISLTHLAIYFSIYIIGYKLSIYSVLIYILLGMLGLPIFSGYTGGLQKIISPTGGYIISYIFLTLIVGAFIYKFKKLPLIILGYILGICICYLTGSSWLAYYSGTNLFKSILIGVLPYIPGDTLKIILAIYLGPKLSKRLRNIK